MAAAAQVKVAILEGPIGTGGRWEPNKQRLNQPSLDLGPLLGCRGSHPDLDTVASAALAKIYPVDQVVVLQEASDSRQHLHTNVHVYYVIW